MATITDSEWEYVKGSDGHIVWTKDGRLMTNGKYFASDTGFHLVMIADHEVQQARMQHELRIGGFLQ